MKEQQQDYRTRKVTVPVWDDYFQKEESVPGVQKIFKEPKLMHNRRNFEFATAYHQPKHQILSIMPEGGKRLSESNLLKIANSFNIDQVKIKEWRSGNTNFPEYSYALYYGEKAYGWDDPSLEIKNTIPSDLDYDQVLCYGITEYDVNAIIHTAPISE